MNQSGSGDTTLAYSAYTESSVGNQEMFGTGGYWLLNMSGDGVHPAIAADSLCATAITGPGNPFSTPNYNVMTSIHP